MKKLGSRKHLKISNRFHATFYRRLFDTRNSYQAEIDQVRLDENAFFCRKQQPNE